MTHVNRGGEGMVINPRDPRPAQGSDPERCHVEEVAAHDPRLRLTLIVDQLYTERAGTENQVSKLIRGLAPQFEIELIALRRTAWLAGGEHKFPCRITILHAGGPLSWGFWRRAVQLWNLLRRRRPDVVHTFFPIANIVGVICAKLAGVRCIVGSRRDYGHWMEKGYLPATRIANRFADYIVTNSEQVKKLTAKVEGFPESRIKVIHNGVSIETLRSAVRDPGFKASLGISEDSKVIVLVGNFRAVKMHKTLVAAAQVLVQQGRDVSLLFLGNDGGNKEDVMRYVGECGLRERVFVARADGNVQDFLAISDIGVNCSESEGLSNAIVEYMAVGLPCVVSDGGGNVDLISHEECGLVFPVGDHIQLARHLERLLDDERLRNRFAKAAYERVSVDMNLERVLDEFASFYRGAPDRRPVETLTV